MFRNTNHVPQLFRPEHYFAKEQFEAERDRLFLTGWHCVGVKALLPKEGDFLTIDLLERPLIIWHTAQGFRAFLNVCTHRFSTLTDKPCGHFNKHLKCQYHGWEYDSDGNTCKIPDAQSFRPLKKGELGLREYRTETVGQLIFVTLNENAPDLRTFLHPELVAFAEERFSPEHRLTLLRDVDIDCNWKIVIENILESYHIAEVHPTSFSEYPIPEHCFHEFHPEFDHFIHDFTEEPRYAKPERIVARLIGRPPDYRWHHILRYPNVVMGGAGPWHYIQMIWPTSPTTCRSRWISMHYSGPKESWWAFLMHRALWRYGRKIARQVQDEDARIYPKVHRGTAVVDRPHSGGLISTREERIVAFQEYILRETGPIATTESPPDNAPFPPTVRFAQS